METVEAMSVDAPVDVIVVVDTTGSMDSCEYFELSNPPENHCVAHASGSPKGVL
jgi:hypothetical protein